MRNEIKEGERWDERKHESSSRLLPTEIRIQSLFVLEVKINIFLPRTHTQCEKSFMNSSKLTAQCLTSGGEGAAMFSFLFNFSKSLEIYENVKKIRYFAKNKVCSDSLNCFCVCDFFFECPRSDTRFYRGRDKSPTTWESIELVFRKAWKMEKKRVHIQLELHGREGWKLSS